MLARLVAWNLMSLDGRFEGVTPWDLSFHMTVWGEELEAFSLEQGAEIGTLLFGRRTYEGMAAHWTRETGAVAEMMNGLPKLVASRTLSSTDWVNSSLVQGDVVDAVRRLKATQARDMFVFGSADLLATLLPAGLVDEYRLCLVPAVLGAGTPLFKDRVPPQTFRLLRADALKMGGVILRYAPASTAESKS
jgi:dihydrofolate reductase